MAEYFDSFRAKAAISPLRSLGSTRLDDEPKAIQASVFCRRNIFPSGVEASEAEVAERTRTGLEGSMKEKCNEAAVAVEEPRQSAATWEEVGADSRG